MLLESGVVEKKHLKGKPGLSKRGFLLPSDTS